MTNANDSDHNYALPLSPKFKVIVINPVEMLQPGNPFSRDELRGMWELYDVQRQHMPLNHPKILKNRIMTFLASCFDDCPRLTRPEKGAKVLYEKLKLTPARKLAKLISAADKAVAPVG